MDLKLQTFFRQLCYVIVIPIPESNKLKTKKHETLCLVVIWQVHTNFPNAYTMLLILYYSQTGALDPADIKFIQCIVSCVEDRGDWGLVDHSGPLMHAVFTEED
jgi:hypothetical protein